MTVVVQDAERCYRIIQGRDPRYDGRFVVAVTSTRIYCRPSCPARTPLRRNVRFYASPAAAQEAGFRACKRCRPDGAPAWRPADAVAGRALALIEEGVVDREGVGGLAARLGFSERHVHRLLHEALGAGPLALARARRAQTARLLAESTDWPLAQVALAAGFTSVRQFNDTVREVYATTPGELRAGGGAARPAGRGTLTLSLAARAPLDGAGVLEFLGARAVAGVEEVTGARYRRVLRLGHGDALVDLEPVGDTLRATVALDDVRDVPAAVGRCRRLFDLDADTSAIAGVLGRDPLLRGLVRARPGLRVPGAADPFELAIRAVLGQQVSVAAARRLAEGLVARLGEPLAAGSGALTHRFPSPEALAAAPDAAFPMPRARAAAVRRVAAHVAGGGPVTPAALLALDGIGPWTAGYVALRLGDPDVVLPTDAGVVRALGGRGDIARRAERWRPWRSYAVAHLWASGS